MSKKNKKAVLPEKVMSAKSRRIMFASISGVFFLGVMLFWALPFQSVLNYCEQAQLFLWTTDYFTSHVARPGGLSDWLASFLTQFNYLLTLGATIIALLYTALQLTTLLVVRTLARNANDGAGEQSLSLTDYLLTFVPTFFLWAAHSDSNVLHSLTISLIATQLAIWGIIKLEQWSVRKRKFVEVVILLIALPIFYWLFGVVVYVLGLFLLIEALRTKRYLGALWALYVVGLVYGSIYLMPFPVMRVMLGLHYYRYPMGVPLGIFVVLAVTLATPYIIYMVRAWEKRLKKAGRRLLCIAAIALVCVGAKVVWEKFNNSEHDLIEYDYLLRMERWDDIIAKADKETPRTPMGVSIVNLALSQRGLLLEQMFNYFQNGPEGLFPAFSRDMFTPVSTAEVFLRLGFVNDCYRYTFEALEAIPDYELSGRLVKRLAQCEIINGHYESARRYLNLLCKTCFYRMWAKESLSLLGIEEAIEAVPLYKESREKRESRNDYLFSDAEMDQMCGLLMMSNHENVAAYEYLVAYQLLMRDIDKFQKYYAAGRFMNYTRIPTIVQQMLVGMWLQTHSDVKQIPFSIESNVLNTTVNLIRTYARNHADKQLNLPPYNTNVLHYILINNDPSLGLEGQ